VLRRAAAVCLLVTLIVPGALIAPSIAGPTLPRGGPLDLSARILAQRSIEEAYWGFREWPSQNPGTKPPLEEVISSAAIRQKALDAVRMTNALAAYWHHTVTGADLQKEIDREAADTKRPDMLRALWQALGNDPRLVAEVLARPILVDRLARGFQASDPRFHGESFEAWWARVGPLQSSGLVAPAFAYRLPNLPSTNLGTWSPTHALPEADLGISAVWTGAEMIIWGGPEVGASKFN
jgi:hypothetical protein